MATEIERKFLLTDRETWRENAIRRIAMRQGYFSGGPDSPTVRVRIFDAEAVLTVKGRAAGLVRSEFEYPIDPADAEAMLDEFCRGRMVEKARYIVPFAEFDWEIDEYFGLNSGLFTAELELAAPDAEFPRPPWLGREVSGEARYTNKSLSHHPYCEWNTEENQ